MKEINDVISVCFKFYKYGILIEEYVKKGNY